MLPPFRCVSYASVAVVVESRRKLPVPVHLCRREGGQTCLVWASSPFQSELRARPPVWAAGGESEETSGMVARAIPRRLFPCVAEGPVPHARHMRLALRVEARAQ